MLRTAYLDTAAIAARLIRVPAVAAHWTEPSALPGFRVSGLAGHLARSVLQVDRIVSEPPATGDPIPVLDHFTRSDWTTADPVGSEVHTAVRHRGEDTASAGPAELADQVDAALARLRERLPIEPADRVIELRGLWCLTLDDFLLTRLLELVVHIDDLSVSVEIPTPEVPQPAVDATVALLARLAVWRHGGLPVIRALARRERAPESIAAL